MFLNLSKLCKKMFLDSIFLEMFSLLEMFLRMLKSIFHYPSENTLYRNLQSIKMCKLQKKFVSDVMVVTHLIIIEYV